MAFPTLFPYDPTCKSRHHSVTLAEAFKHLERYCIIGDLHHIQGFHTGLLKGMSYFLNYYIKQHPCDAGLTVEQLQEMIGTMNSTQLMNRLQRYATKLLGSRQYWYTRYQELKALLEQKGAATFFWTVSSADNYYIESEGSD